MYLLIRKLIPVVDYCNEKLFVSIYIIYTQSLDAEVLDEAAVEWRTSSCKDRHRLRFILCCLSN